MNDNLAALLQRLCEIDPPEMSQQWIDRHESRESIEALISCGALIPAENAGLVLCERCDDEHWIVPEYLERGQYRGFCAITGYHGISPKALKCFMVDDSWIVSGICASLGIRPKKNQTDGSQALLCLGRARFGPYLCELFFGRRLHDRPRLGSAVAVVAEKTASCPGILLTSTGKELLSGPVPGRCVVIRMENVLTIAHGRTSFDGAPILAALRGTVQPPREGGVGFRHSPGYRTCVYGSESFRFSKQRALAVEVLHNGVEGWAAGPTSGRIEGSTSD